jgi:16S rRNA (uracil1498-N3)-methyltransferase
MTNDPLFFCESLPPVGAVAQLRGDEARHAAGARRLKPGDTLLLFDGRGTIARARFQALGDRGREVEAVIEEHRQLPRPRPEVHLACALPKGDRAAVMLDMATQLGMASFTPLLCEHSVVKPGEGTLERLRRVCLEACKQSRRAWLPEIYAPATLAQMVARDGIKWIAHPDGKAVAELAMAIQEPVTVLVGPEGGFTTPELEQAVTHGAHHVALGTTILRVETAAVTLVGMAMLQAS